MPLLRGKSKRAKRANFHELRHGKTYAHTRKKFGKKRAQKQMVAIALKQSRLSDRKKLGSKKKRKTGRKRRY